MLSYLRRNLPWLLISLLLAITLWLIVTRQEYPEETNLVTGVAVEVVGTPADLVLRNRPSSVRLWVSAPRQRWARLGPDSFRASLDASRAQVGVQELPVRVASLDPTAKVLSVEPSRTSIGLERLASKDVRVQVRVMDSASFGYRVGSPTVAPERVRVSGPESMVDQVVSVVAAVRLESARSQVSEWVRPVPQSVDGRELREISVSPETVLVEVPMEQELAYRTMPVVPQVTGEPGLGYQVAGITVEPPSITVVGDPAEINELRFLTTRPVDLGRTTRDLAVNAEPVFPGRVTLARAQQIVVRVSITPIPGTVTTRVAPTVTGVEGELEATIEPAAVQVVLSGPMPQLNSLTAGDIQATAVVTEQTIGPRRVALSVTSPPGITVERVVPSDVTVTLRPASTSIR